MNSCKIIVYHYVRPIKKSKYPDIKGLEVDAFNKQIQYFKENFNFITAKMLLEGIYNNIEIPQNSILLTFDDGFKDHYLHVFPTLKKLGIQGLFFPPAEAIEKNKISDVHKIHFILEGCKNKNVLIEYLRDFIHQYENEYELESFDFYFSNIAIANRFDSKEIIFIKRMLQKVLPRKLRNMITDVLFKKFVTNDQNSFAKDLYLSYEEIEEMKNAGMYFGSHAYSHEWLSNLSHQDFNLEIRKSIEFLNKINQDKSDWMMAYPYGDYNESIIQRLQTYGFKVAFTSRPGDAELSYNNAFSLKRYDTNDFS